MTAEPEIVGNHLLQPHPGLRSDCALMGCWDQGCFLAPLGVTVDEGVILLISCMLGSTVAYASNTSLLVSSNVYDLDKDSHYVIGEASPSGSAAIGTLSINGDVRTSSEVNSFPAYEISNGNASFTYKISSGVFNRAEEEWHIVDDKTKKVNGLTLDEDILSGASVHSLLSGLIAPSMA